MTENSNKSMFVHCAENKKVVTPSVTKNKRKTSKFGLSVYELSETYDFDEMKYEKTLAEELLQICKEKGINSDGAFQNKTNVLRIQYSRLKNNKYHLPQKELLFAIFIGLEVSIEKVTELLLKSGFSFTYDLEFEQKTKLPSFDRLIHDCILLGIYDIDEINVFLAENDYTERLGSKSLL